MARANEPTPARRGSDRELGMGRKISRRDFLNGIPVGAGALALPGLSGWVGEGAASPLPSGPYPPALTGLRGSHPGSFEVAHALRDRVRTAGGWDDSGAEDGGGFDLVVVGGGIIGLATAWLYRKAVGRDARILVLDNHDDFGGHARRNEFLHEGRTVLGYGGTQSLDSPATFSRASRDLLDDLRVDLDLFPHRLRPRPLPLPRPERRGVLRGGGFRGRPAGRRVRQAPGGGIRRGGAVRRARPG